MTVAVVVPWRDTHPDRARSHTVVREHLRWLLPDALHIDADDGSQTFSRAGSRNHGVHLAEQACADVVVVCDADTIPLRDPHRVPLLEAIEQAADGLLHMPYAQFLGLTEHGSSEYLGGRPARECEVELDYAYSVGGVFVIRPDAWRTTGGMDERFTAWGCEDKAFRRAADTLLGPTVTHPGTIVHLWHPPAQRCGTPENDAVWALADRYAAAEGDMEAMRALIAERGVALRSAHGQV